MNSSTSLTTQNIIKAIKTKNFQYRNEKCLTEKTLIALNNELFVMRAQNSTVLKIQSIFNNIASEYDYSSSSSNSPSKGTITTNITDMQFYPSSSQNPNNNQDQKNILALIDASQQCIHVLEITIDHEKGTISVSPYEVHIPSSTEDSSKLSQLTWLPNTLLSLDNGSTNGSISIHPFIQEKRVLNTIEDRLSIFSNCGSNELSSAQNQSISISQIASVEITGLNTVPDRIMFYAISGDGKHILQRIYPNAAGDSAAVFQLPNDDQLEKNEDEFCNIFVCRYGDVVAISKQGRIFQLRSSNLAQVQEISLDLQGVNSENSSGVVESIIEAQMDNTRTSIFMLTNRNILHHLFLEKNLQSINSLYDPFQKSTDHFQLISESVFRSRGVIRFHPKNILFTFRVITIPSEMKEASILAKNSTQAPVSVPTNFIPSENNEAKFIVFALLVQDNDNQKIFSSNLSNHINLTEKVYDGAEWIEMMSIQQKRQESKREVELEAIRVKEEAERAEKDLLLRQELEIMERIKKAKSQEQLNFEALFQQHILAQENGVFPTLNVPEIQKEIVPAQISLPPTSNIIQNEPLQKEVLPEVEVAVQVEASQAGTTYLNVFPQQSSSLMQIEEKGVALLKKGSSKKMKKQQTDIKKLVKFDPNQKSGSIDEFSLSELKSPIQISKQHSTNSNRDSKGDKMQKRINLIMESNIHRLKDTIQNYFVEKAQNAEVAIDTRVEEFGSHDLQKTVEIKTRESREKLIGSVRDKVQTYHEKYVQTAMQDSLLDMFEQVTQTFKKGQRFYTEKLATERQNHVVHHQNTQEIQALSNKISASLTESSVHHKKINSDLPIYQANSNERKKNLQRQLILVSQEQEQLLAKIASIEHQCTFKPIFNILLQFMEGGVGRKKHGFQLIKSKTNNQHGKQKLRLLI